MSILPPRPTHHAHLSILEAGADLASYMASKPGLRRTFVDGLFDLQDHDQRIFVCVFALRAKIR